MKKLILLVLSAMLILPCFSQDEEKSFFNEVGLMIGPGYSHILGGESWKGTLGMQFGVETQVRKFNENSSVYAGVLLSIQGANYEESYDYEPYEPYYTYKLKSAMDEYSYKGKVSLMYIAIPILYNHLLDNGVYLEGGIQPGFLVSAKDKIEDGESYDYSDWIKSFDLGIPVGGGFWIEDKISVGARVVFGLTNINDSGNGMDGFESSDTTDRNFMLLGVVRYNFQSAKER